MSHGYSAATPASAANPGTALVTERDSGRILELDEKGRAREVTRLEDVAAGGEGGLLGLAFREPDELFVYSTTAEGNRIQRFRLEGAPGTFDLSDPVTLVGSLPAAAIHNGGRIAFGPDGMLYAGVGDAGDPSRAQDLGSLGGKILRMNPDGSVPEDNPFAGSYIYSFGHRNVQGLAWDEDGTMYASEFGQNSWDELNVITPAGNYGWPEVEGLAPDDEFISPIAQWPTDEASPSGMAIKDGILYMANLRGERLRRVDLSDPARQGELWADGYSRFRDVVATPQNQLWALTNNTDGRGTPEADDDLILLVDPDSFTSR